jgi:hypothetical protein
VRIEGGYATVTGYKLLRATVLGDGKAEARFDARSQDIGSIVLVVAGLAFASPMNFSVKEKDEASALTVFNAVECLHSRCSEDEGFFLHLQRWSLVKSRIRYGCIRKT